MTGFGYLADECRELLCDAAENEEGGFGFYAIEDVEQCVGLKCCTAGELRPILRLWLEGVKPILKIDGQDMR